ncbi:hypothetical protein [Lachnospira sp.]|jgi:hypothetical protein|uniref:hypothetical protein n=1 Tax=Lachnospira sp. TaxID=2049031 RepID=UPI00257EEC7F|nr:hypothetical protein [Lachnospira sp.]
MENNDKKLFEFLGIKLLGYAGTFGRNPLIYCLFRYLKLLGYAGTSDCDPLAYCLSGILSFSVMPGLSAATRLLTDFQLS